VNKNHFVLSFESYSLWLNALIFLLILAELLYRDGTIMAYVGGAVVFVAAIGAIMTSIYLLGMLERQDRTVLGVGWDSAAAVLIYIGGMAVLYFIA
jgi:cation:H+ antiporter